MTLKPTLDEYKEIFSKLNFLRCRLNKIACTLALKTGNSKEPFILTNKAERNVYYCIIATESLMSSHYPNIPTAVFKAISERYRMPKDLQKQEDKTVL